MVRQETRAIEATPMAQSASWHRRRHAGNPGNRDHRQPGRRCRAGKRHRFERTGEVCCPNCWTRSPPTSLSARSPRTVLMIHGPATLPLRRAALVPSYPHARTPGHGWKTHRARRQGMRLFDPAAALAVPSGGVGADTTGEAWSRQKCGASSCSGSASWRATSTGRWQSYKSGQRS